MSLLLLLFALAAPVVAWQLWKNPFFGLLLILAVNPLEPLLPRLPGLSMGRLIGFVVAFVWFIHLLRDPASWRRMRRSRLIRCVWAFPLFCAIGTLLNLGGAEGLGEGGGKGLDALIKLVILITMALMIENMVDSQKRLNFLLLALILSSFVAVFFPFAYNLGYDLYSPLGIDLKEVTAGERAGGLQGDANSLGMTASAGVFALVVYLNSRRRLIVGLMLAGIAFVIISGLVLSGNRTHFVGLIVFLTAFFGLRMMGPTRGLAYSIIASLALLVLIPWAYRKAPERIQERLIVVGANVNKYTERRADLIDEQRDLAWTYFRDNPLFGVGLRGFEAHGGLMAHDSYSALLGETGLLGMASILWVVGACFYWLCRSGWFFYRTGQVELYYCSVGFIASMVATVIAGMGGYVFFAARWLWFALGVAAVVARWADGPARQAVPRPARPAPGTPPARPLVLAPPPNLFRAGGPGR